MALSDRERLAQACLTMMHNATEAGDLPWRAKALSMFSKDVPEIVDPELCDSSNMYDVWGWLTSSFKDAYRGTPPNDSLIGRVYEFARWCCSQPRGESADDDLLSCVVVCFDEELPQMSAAMLDMPRWFSPQELQEFRDTTLSRLLPADEIQRWWTLWERTIASQDAPYKNSVREKDPHAEG